MIIFVLPKEVTRGTCMVGSYPDGDLAEFYINQGHKGTYLMLGVHKELEAYGDTWRTFELFKELPAPADSPYRVYVFDSTDWVFPVYVSNDTKYDDD